MREQGGTTMRKRVRTRGGGAAHRPKGNRRAELGRRERQRLLQLGFCLAVFLAVLVGRGVFPGQMVQVGEQAAAVLGRSVDFKGAFERLGEAIGRQRPVSEAVGEFCVTVFGISAVEEPDPALSGAVSQGEARFLSAGPSGYEAACRRLWLEPEAGTPAAVEEGQAEPEQPEEETVLPVGAVVEQVPYEGEALPEDATMDRLSIGTLQWTVPVQGTKSSDFGYREHPVEGGVKFHYGVDIAADKGTAIAAFAAGTVAFTGESTTYGKYFQLDHGNGITTLYAHCDTVEVSEADTVALGQQVATVGDSGLTTGSHLHFELCVAGTRTDPAWYFAQG